MSTRWRPPFIYPITDEKLSSLTIVGQVSSLCAAGAKFIQIRAKDLSGRDFFDQAVSAQKIAKRAGSTLIINDRVDIALAIDADGVHLGQDDLDPDDARSLLGNKKIIGYSTHSVEQAIAASSKQIDYIAIGPIFATTTKKDADPVVGLDGFAAVKAAIGDIPLVAIGGIDETNVRSVIDAGADSAAVISAVYRRGISIADRLKTLADALK